MPVSATLAQWILGSLLILSSLGVLFAKKPVHSALSFLFALLMLASLYLQLSAEFIAVMQILVYAGAIMVIFMFVVVLFQDAHAQISKYHAQSLPLLLYGTAAAFLIVFTFLGMRLFDLLPATVTPVKGFGTAESLGLLLYIDFFFPFEAVILIFLVSVIGALYIGKKEN
jgi:NADH-quinone oxidoreductase subunit J